MQGDITALDCLLVCMTEVEKMSNGSRTVGVHAVETDCIHICHTTLRSREFLKYLKKLMWKITLGQFCSFWHHFCELLSTLALFTVLVFRNSSKCLNLFLLQ